jgi:hypothetical protein
MAQQCDSGEHVRGWEDPISNHPPGQPPGWLLSYRVNMTNTDGWGSYDSGTVDSPINAQYHYPAVTLDDYYQQYDSATACSAETTNRGGTGVLPSLCGSLLDSYVNAIIPPAPTGAVPDLSVPDETWVVRVDQREVPDGTYLEVRQPVDYADQVFAVDPDRGSLIPDCFPGSGTALGLGITRVHCVATDLDGDSVEGDFNVHVQYPFEFVGRFDGRRKTVFLKAGRHVEIEFSTDGYKGLDVFAATPTSTRIDCETGEIKGQPSDLVSGRDRHSHKRYNKRFKRHQKHNRDQGHHGHKGHQGHKWSERDAGIKNNESGGLEYDRRHDEYSQSWQTDRRWKHQCRRISLPLVDGTTQTTDVRFH